VTRTERIDCRNCGGDGYSLAGGPCPACKGTGKVERPDPFYRMRLRPGDAERPAFIIVREPEAGGFVSVRMTLRQFAEFRRRQRLAFPSRGSPRAVLVGDLLA
jgi:RecJ-like exonuclease